MTRRSSRRSSEQLRAELDGLREAGTLQALQHARLAAGPVVEMEGRGEVLVLSSNNYLGLAAHPEVVEAGIEGLRRYGAGTASVRFICGTFEPHLELERELAELVGHRGGAHLRLVLERERGGRSRASPTRAR